MRTKACRADKVCYLSIATRKQVEGGKMVHSLGGLSVICDFVACLLWWAKHQDLHKVWGQKAWQDQGSIVPFKGTHQ